MPEEVLSAAEAGLTKEQYRNLGTSWQQYAELHPESALAPIMVYKALYYAGDHDEKKLQSFIVRSLDIDPQCPEALVAAMATSLRHGDSLYSHKECYDLGLRAVEAAPNWARPHTQLYVLAILLGRDDDARLHLKAILNKGLFPPSIIDYGYNMLISAEPNGIIFTNGDNDTFPCLALQAGKGIRPDVTIANLSIMTLEPIARYCLTQETDSHAAVLSPETMDLIVKDFQQDRAAYRYMLSNALLEHICLQSATDQLQRPLYLGVTVYPDAVALCGSSLSLVGLLQKVMPGTHGTATDPVTDISKTFQLFNRKFRLDSATDLTASWNRTPSHVQLMNNYTNILLRLAIDADSSGRADIREYSFLKSIELASFHHQDDMMAMIEKYWTDLAPRSGNLKRWQQEKQ